MLALALLLLALAEGWLPLGPTADGLFAAAARNFDQAPAVAITALSVEHDGQALTGSLTAARSGDASMRLLTADGGIEGRIVGTATYARAGRAYWARTTSGPAANVLAGRWVLDHSARLATLVSDLTAPGTYSHLGGSGFTRAGQARVAGVAAARLHSRAADVWVSTAAPIRLLRVAYAAGHADPAGETGLRADFGYPGSVPVGVPTPYLDLEDPATLPARFVYQGTDPALPPCDPAGCRLGAVVRNANGAAAGQSTITFRAQSADGSRDLGSCTAAIPAAAYGGVEKVSCVVRSAALKAYSTAGNTSFRYTPTIYNPIWDD